MSFGVLDYFPDLLCIHSFPLWDFFPIKLYKYLSVLSTVFCPQSIRRTTWWAATGRVMLNTTSWPLWKKLPQDWWRAASITSNPNSPTTTSTTCCPGNGTSTSKKTGQTKNRPSCLGPRGWDSPSSTSAPPPPPPPPFCVQPSLPSLFWHFMPSHPLCACTHPSSLTAAVASAVVADPPSTDSAPGCVRNSPVLKRLTPTFQRSGRRLPQSEVHVETRVRARLRFGLF